MMPSIYSVTTIGDGELYVMPKPSADWLDDEAKQFAAMGIQRVVCHLEAAEMAELGLSREAEAFKSVGIEFIHHPIPDRQLPEAKAHVALVEECYQALLSGKNTAVHCRAGIGRTGVTATCLLIRDGFDSQTAIDMVSAARGVPIPDTQAQYDFICDYRSGF